MVLNVSFVIYILLSILIIIMDESKAKYIIR